MLGFEGFLVWMVVVFMEIKCELINISGMVCIMMVYGFKGLEVKIVILVDLGVVLVSVIYDLVFLLCKWFVNDLFLFVFVWFFIKMDWMDWY